MVSENKEDERVNCFFKITRTSPVDPVGLKLILDAQQVWLFLEHDMCATPVGLGGATWCHWAPCWRPSF